MGVPAKGRKRDLVNALKCLVDTKIDGTPTFDNAS